MKPRRRQRTVEGASWRSRGVISLLQAHHSCRLCLSGEAFLTAFTIFPAEFYKEGT
jgi:hypothetical protein